MKRFLLLAGVFFSVHVLASETLADSSMAFVDSSGFSVYESSSGSDHPPGNGNGNPGVAYFKVTDVAQVDSTHYQMALQPVALNTAKPFMLQLSPEESHSVRAGDIVYSRHEPYGYAFGNASSGGLITIAVTSDWLRAIPPRRVF
jgi:hypothetical protein